MCNISMDEVQAPANRSFLGILKSWYTQGNSALKDSRPALRHFIREFLTDAPDLAVGDPAENTQECRLFFAAMAPNEAR